MKTSRLFSPFYKQPQWKTLNDSLKTLGSELVFWLSGLRLPGGFILLNHLQTLVAAGKVAKTGLHALVLATSANKRLYVGLGLVGIVAPLSGFICKMFNIADVVDGWYHVNAYYLFFVLGPFIVNVVVCIGIYHLFPNKSKRAFILAVPMGFSIGKIIWLIAATNNDQFHEITPTHLVLVGILISLIVLLCTEWFAWRWAHRTRAFDSRLDSLDNIVDEPSISDSQFRSMFRQVYRDKKEFPKQF
jgi:hypothetical protein